MANLLNGLSHRLAGRRWDRNSAASQRGGYRNWWHSPLLKTYVDRRISTEHEAGVPGALRVALGGKPAGRAISVGAGAGEKELSLISAGLVDHFSLYELSRQRVEQARSNAEEAGLGEHVTVQAADAFARTHDPYDLVYWDHALHHMLDVSQAVAWSVDVLRPGGFLLINDYVGPTRLQWSRGEVRFARQFVVEAEALHGQRLPMPRYRTPISRLRQMLRDPSEAPESDQIIPACRQHCEGFAPALIGCAMINICGPLIGSVFSANGPVQELLTEWDQKAEARGMSHFAFGIWQKPA